MAFAYLKWEAKVEEGRRWLFSFVFTLVVGGVNTPMEKTI